MKLRFKRLLKTLFVKLGIPQMENNYLFFICNNEALPRPLTEVEEGMLVRSFVAGSIAAKMQLIEHNIRLVIFVAKKFENTGFDTEDLISVGSIGLIKAVNSFNADKNIKLATYASRCIENEILMHLRRFSKVKSEVSFDEPLNTDYDGNELLLADILGTEGDIVYKDFEKSVESDLLHECVDKLEAREKEIIEFRFGMNGKDEKTQKEVADMLHISQSYISRLEKKIIDRLKTEMSRKLR